MIHLSVICGGRAIPFLLRPIRVAKPQTGRTQRSCEVVEDDDLGIRPAPHCLAWQDWQRECVAWRCAFLWKVMKHKSSTVAFKEYKLMLRLLHRLLSKHSDVMLLADRSFANHQLISWLKTSQWHYCLRLPCDVFIHGVRKHPIELKYLYPPKSQRTCLYIVNLYYNVRLWLDFTCNSKVNLLLNCR